MMNLDEILKGIGAQMSKSVPSWSNPLQPQVQNPQAFPESNPFGNYLAGQFPEQGPGGYGSFQEQTPGFGSFAEKPSSGIGFPERQNEALSHVAAAKTSATTAAHPGNPSSGDQETEQYIRQAAAQRGIDPDTAVQVWGDEGRSAYAGDNGSSYGPYQLHYGGVASGGNSVGGLGDAFTKQTGLDARDPKTWQAQVDFALDNVKNGGWTPFHGAAAQGIGPRQGVGTYSPPPSTPSQSAPGAPESQFILQRAQPFIGKPYVWGGKSTASGFDCSGLAGYLAGTGQPESTVSLYAKSAPISEQQAQPGDLVFYNMNQGDMHLQHVATYLGNGKIVQAGGTDNTVNIGQAHQAVGSAPEFRRIGG
jgi:cell wall-associated NlpC family hydrolase